MKLSKDKDHQRLPDDDGAALCEVCGSIKVVEDGESICPSCDARIDFFGEDDDEDDTK